MASTGLDGVIFLLGLIPNHEAMLAVAAARVVSAVADNTDGFAGRQFTLGRSGVILAASAAEVGFGLEADVRSVADFPAVETSLDSCLVRVDTEDASPVVNLAGDLRALKGNLDGLRSSEATGIHNDNSGVPVHKTLAHLVRGAAVERLVNDASNRVVGRRHV